MKSTGPIFIRDMKEAKAKRKKRDVIDVDAKKAYAFVNQKAKRRENSMKRLASISRQVAEVSAKCESLILESWPVQMASNLVGNTWPIRMAKRLNESLKTFKSPSKN